MTANTITTFPLLTRFVDIDFIKPPPSSSSPFLLVFSNTLEVALSGVYHPSKIFCFLQAPIFSPLASSLFSPQRRQILEKKRIFFPLFKQAIPRFPAKVLAGNGTAQKKNLAQRYGWGG